MKAKVQTFALSNCIMFACTFILHIFPIQLIERSSCSLALIDLNLTFCSKEFCISFFFVFFRRCHETNICRSSSPSWAKGRSKKSASFCKKKPILGQKRKKRKTGPRKWNKLQMPNCVNTSGEKRHKAIKIHSCQIQSVSRRVVITKKLPEFRWVFLNYGY